MTRRETYQLSTTGAIPSFLITAITVNGEDSDERESALALLQGWDEKAAKQFVESWVPQYIIELKKSPITYDRRLCSIGLYQFGQPVRRVSRKGGTLYYIKTSKRAWVWKKSLREEETLIWMKMIRKEGLFK